MKEVETHVILNEDPHKSHIHEIYIYIHICIHTLIYIYIHMSGVPGGFMSVGLTAHP